MGWPSFVSYYLDAIKMGADAGDGAAASTAPTTCRRWPTGSARARRSPTSATPNNPTGSMVGREALAAFVDARARATSWSWSTRPTATTSPIPTTRTPIAEHVARRPNVAVLRTFSKIYGLAGLRVGYMVGPPEVVREVMKIRNAFDVSELAHVAALASLDDADELRRRRDVNERGRIDMEAMFAGLGMRPFPACANFLAVDVGEGRALADALLREGVIVRPLDPFGAPECIRVTVGTPEENAILADVLARALQPR